MTKYCGALHQKLHGRLSGRREIEDTSRQKGKYHNLKHRCFNSLNIGVEMKMHKK